MLTVGLTPTWQRVLRFESLTVGAVNRTDSNRAESVVECAAGKSINTAIAA